MKFRYTLILVLALLTSFAKSQNEKINQLDVNGKKHGVWIVWLDSDWKLAKDSMSAVYCRYNYFNHGANIYAMGPWGGKNSKMEGKPNNVTKKGNAKLLDGEYSWYKNGVLRSTHVLKDGWYVSFKEFYSDGTVQTFFDYTKRDEKDKYSYLMTTYNKKGEKTFSDYAYSNLGGKGVDN